MDEEKDNTTYAWDSETKPTVAPRRVVTAVPAAENVPPAAPPPVASAAAPARPILLPAEGRPAPTPVPDQPVAAPPALYTPYTPAARVVPQPVIKADQLFD